MIPFFNFKTVRFFNPDNNAVFFIFLFTICLQLTDAKILNVKISEILLLTLLIFFTLKQIKLNKYIYWYLLFFLFLFIKTLIQNYFTTFYINTPLTILKQPYYLNLGRFIELFCCIILAYATNFYFQSLPIQKIYRVLEVFLQFQIYIIGFIFIFFYLLYKNSVLHFSADQGFLVYDSTGIYGYVTCRLKGFYVEGGPLGLFYAYLFILYDWILKQRVKSDLLGRVLIILIIFLASSKAGGSLLVIYMSYRLYSKMNSNRFRVILNVFFLPIGAILALLFLYYFASSYITTIGIDVKFNISQDLDTNFFMGRVSGLVIVPRILLNHYMLGVGLGNYPLVRNNPLYLGEFPAIPVNLWDVPGLGGLTDLMVDGGLIFFSAFFVIVYKIYRDIKFRNKELYPIFLSFILPFVFGSQLYFLYPWFSLGLLIVFLRITETSGLIQDVANINK